MAGRDKYAEALQELDDLHRDGRISDAKYELHKARLLAEASRPRQPFAVRLIVFVGAVIAGLILLRLVGAVFSAFVGG